LRTAIRTAEESLAGEDERKKKEPLSIGMSKQDVVGRKGAAAQVNSLTTQRGTIEIWQYNDVVLKFENDTLTAIQR
jgi:hypothetical protein